MGDFSTPSSVRRAFLRIAPAVFGAGFLPAAPQHTLPEEIHAAPGTQREAVRLPNGKLQNDEILKADYAQNLKDARDLTDLAKSFELELEKSDRFVLSLPLLKKLDEMEKLTRRIRGRMRK